MWNSVLLDRSVFATSGKTKSDQVDSQDPPRLGPRLGPGPGPGPGGPSENAQRE